jgi:DNA-binding CsgD family transcriptional regulator
MVQKGTVITAQEREIARRACTGASQSEIASGMGIHRHTVQRALQRPDVRAHVARLHDEIDKELVRSMIFNPWVEILTDAASQQRQRKRRL